MPSTQRLKWLHHNKFYETTTLFGFGLIHKSRNIYEIIWWYGVIFICTVLTVKDLVSLVIQYNSGDTVTSMKIGRQQLALFPNMTFCVQMRLPEVNPEFMTGSRKNLSLLTNVMPLQDEVNAALVNFNGKQDVLEKPWNYIMLPLLFRYFASMRLLEVEPGFLKPSSTSTLSGHVLKTFLHNTPYYSTISQAIYSTLNHTRSLGVEDVDLFERFSKELVTFSQFKARYSERTMVSSKDHNLKPKLKLLFYKMSSLIVHGFCFDFEPHRRMQENRKTSHHVQSRLDFTIGSGHRDNILKRNYGFSMTQLAKSINIGGKFEEENLDKLEVILGDEYGENEFLDFPSLTAEISETVRAHVTTTALYKSIINCSPLQTKDSCILQCKTDIITKFCVCTPLLSIKTTNHMKINNRKTKMCKLEKYLHCLKPWMVKQYNKCIEKCESACLNVKYTLIPHTIRKYRNYRYGKIYIHRKHTEYPIFVESYAQSFESFFGELGGILGLYLGASILAFLHLLIYLVEQIVPLCRRKNDNEYARNKEAIEMLNHDRFAEGENGKERNGLVETDLNLRLSHVENRMVQLSDRIELISKRLRL